jgi:prepilin-type N-terminal cleavage/methylation domain-containing protein
MQLTRRRQRGFTLTELAVVFAIVALLIGGAFMTLSAQVEQRNYDETMRRLNAAADAVLAFAIVNRRLPCPATAGTTGDEAFTGSNCTTWYGGFLPARSIGFQPVDGQGYGLDVWNNRIRYAVAQNVTGCSGAAVNPHFVSAANLKTNGMSCQPNDLDICAPVDNSTTCTAANRVVSTGTAAVIIFSTGKNGAIAAAQGPHEAANLDGNATFISHTPSGSDSATGTYDDLMIWVPAGMVYSKLISAGVLP